MAPNRSAALDPGYRGVVDKIVAPSNASVRDPVPLPTVMVWALAGIAASMTDVTNPIVVDFMMFPQTF